MWHFRRPAREDACAGHQQLEGKFSYQSADAGWRRHGKACRAGVVAWYKELARVILRRSTPTPAGDKPPRYIPLAGTSELD